MIYKVLLLVFSLTQIGIASASTTDVDLEGLNAHSEENLTGQSGIRGSIGVESSSFMYNSDVHGTSSTTVEATLDATGNSRTLHSFGNLQIYSYAKKKPEFGVESRELYVQTQAGLLGDSQVTVGRKIEEWSKLDRTWTMMSLWSPRWTWDELHPELVGMTGVFYTHKNKNLEITAYGSPLAVPERGTPVTEENHNLVSPNPFWKPLPTQQTILGKPTEVRYSLFTPSLDKILLRPNFALRGKYEFDNGFWLSANSGVLPVNMVQMAAEYYLQSTTTSYAQVNIRPQFPMRNINTVESGYNGVDHSWDIWTSVSYEQPFQFENQSTWLNPIITPSTIVSGGTGVQLTHNFRFEGSALFIHEEPFTNTSSVPGGVSVSLPSRFPLKQGLKMGGVWQFTELDQSNLAWIQDLKEQNHFISADFEHRFFTSNIIVGGGADILVASSNKGWVGQYYGDDRLRGWLKYAF